MRYVEDADRYRIIAGENRYQAAKQAGLKELPCWERTPGQNQILLQQVVENWVRSDLNPFELADALGLLRDANGYSQVQLAATTGKSQGEISKILGLLELDPETQKLAREDETGLVSRRHLHAIRDFPIARQIKLIAGIKDGRYTAEALELLHANERKKQSVYRSAEQLATPIFPYTARHRVVSIPQARSERTTTSWRPCVK